MHEAIYTILMQHHDFISASANIENIDPEVGDMPVVARAATAPIWVW